MRILIDNSGYELLNLGDLAMLQVAVERFRAMWPGAQITVITVAPEQLKKHVPGTRALLPEGRDVWLRRTNLLGFFRKVMPQAEERISEFENRMRRRWPRMVRDIIEERFRFRGWDSRPMIQFLDSVFEADLVVGTGGGYLTDSFKEHGADVLETLHLASTLGIPTALLGQGIGPAEQEFIRDVMRRVLPSVDLITLREALTSRPLALEMNANPRRVLVTGDDAIEPAYAARPSELGNAIGVNLRTTWYAGVPDGATLALRNGIADVAQRLRSPVVPLPVSSHGNGEDHRAIAELTRGMGDGFSEPVDSPAALIRRVSLCRTVITGSYHAGVFALSQGIPVTALARSEYYVNKFLGLAEQFPGGVTIVRLDDPKLRQRVSEAALKNWNDAPSLRAVLVASAQNQIRAGRDAYQQLGDIVQERSRRHERPARVCVDAGL
ncbi:MAG TPA: polysaccharide pyruvyl transferase family protein [Tepidisphaeraceae bacterium]